MSAPAGDAGDGVRGRDFLVFRVGAERFAAPLGSVDEALDFAPQTVQPIPGDNPALHGVFPLRGALVPLYGPGPVLGITAPMGTTALVVRVGSGAGRAAIAVDDVDDVLTVTEDALRGTAGTAAGETVLRGVLHREGNIIAIVDLNALVTACRASDGRERQ